MISNADSNMFDERFSPHLDYEDDFQTDPNLSKELAREILAFHQKKKSTEYQILNSITIHSNG